MPCVRSEPLGSTPKLRNPVMDLRLSFEKMPVEHVTNSGTEIMRKIRLFRSEQPPAIRSSVASPVHFSQG